MTQSINLSVWASPVQLLYVKHETEGGLIHEIADPALV